MFLYIDLCWDDFPRIDSHVWNYSTKKMQIFKVLSLYCLNYLQGV